MAYIQGPVRNQDILDFWNQHRFQIYKLCRNKVQAGISIQDLLQNVYIRLHTHFEEIQTLSNPSGWLMRVAENVCYDEIRRLMRTQNVSEAYYRYEVDQSLKNIKQVFDEQQINSFLNSISPHWGTMVDLHYLKGFPVSELAEISGMSKSTFAKRLQRSVRQMRENMDPAVKKS